MPRNFNLSSLVQEHDTFTDVDGAVHDIRNQADLGITEMARAQKIQSGLPTWMEQLAKNPSADTIAARIEQAINDLVLIIVPTMGAERVAAMTLGQKQALLDFWSQGQKQRRAQDEDGKAGEEEAGQAQS